MKNKRDKNSGFRVQRIVRIIGSAVVVFGVAAVICMVYNGRNNVEDVQDNTSFVRSNGQEYLSDTGEKAELNTAEPADDGTAKPTVEPATKPSNNSETKSTPATTAAETQPPRSSENPSTAKPEPAATSPIPEDVSAAVVPESDAVDDDYFKDALFIGDSRVEGFMLSSGISGGSFVVKTGISITSLDEDKIVKHNGKTMTLYDYLRQESFGKIYIKAGLNELGWVSVPSFIKEYSKVIENIKTLQPDAEIYVQSIIHVTSSKSGDGGIYTNETIDKFNEQILEMAAAEGVNYINLNEVFTNEYGALDEEAANDGVHLKASYCKKWLEYLKTHTRQRIED